MRGGNIRRRRPAFGGSNTRLASKGPEPSIGTARRSGAPSRQENAVGRVARQTAEQGKRSPEKPKTSGRALPEVSEVYQKAAKEFHWLP
jgi:hypothetical protein